MCILVVQTSSDNIIKQQFVNMQYFALMGDLKLDNNWAFHLHRVFPRGNFLQIELLWNGQLSFKKIQFKGFTCFPCFLLVVWCVGLSFKFLELFHYSIVKLLQVLCLMAPLNAPLIFKYNVFFGFQLPSFPLQIFPPNFVLLESSRAPFSTTNPNITSLCNVVVTSSHAHFNIINYNASDYASNYYQWKYP